MRPSAREHVSATPFRGRTLATDQLTLGGGVSGSTVDRRSAETRSGSVSSRPIKAGIPGARG
ncbi:MAG TPA: hypothetical protein VLV16_02110 [Gemmatimonadales bacterium]|nr:hypothetical protein [Gemmatimonadales bacterium]